MIKIKNKINNINKDNLKRKYFLNKEIKKIILKSIIQNLNLKPVVRALAHKKLSKIRIIHSISKQTNNLCLKTGKFKGVLKINNISRHELKKNMSTGSLHNFKINSW